MKVLYYNLIETGIVFIYYSIINEVGFGFVLKWMGCPRCTLVYIPILQFFSHPFRLGQPKFFEAVNCIVAAVSHRSSTLVDCFSNFQRTKFVCTRCC